MVVVGIDIGTSEIRVQNGDTVDEILNGTVFHRIEYAIFYFLTFSKLPVLHSEHIINQYLYQINNVYTFYLNLIKKLHQFH